MTVYKLSLVQLGSPSWSSLIHYQCSSFLSVCLLLLALFSSLFPSSISSFNSTIVFILWKCYQAFSLLGDLFSSHIVSENHQVMCCSHTPQVQVRQTLSKVLQRGTLHLHMILWLLGSLPVPQMCEYLLQEDFRSKIKKNIATNIHANLLTAPGESILSIVMDMYIFFCFLSWSDTLNPLQAV
jgi:hypothetical protein